MSGVLKVEWVFTFWGSPLSFLVVIMDEKWTQQEVAFLIQARKLLKAKGLSKDADVKAICEAAGISRKTGYQWANGLKFSDDRIDCHTEELSELKLQCEHLKERCRRLEIENEGHRLAWEIHGVDELMAAKKNIIHKAKKKKR